MILYVLPISLMAQTMAFDNFSKTSSETWQLITDQVMGGVSHGKLEFVNENSIKFARMTGEVRLENNGGFIQFRRALSQPLRKNLTGLKIKVRSNGHKYSVHIRTRGTFLPWHFYQADFQSSDSWSTIMIPFTSFNKSSWMVPTNFLPSDVESIAIVAIGSAHPVFVEVANIWLY